MEEDSCIKIGSDESHFNVSLIVKDKVTRLSTDYTFDVVTRAPRNCDMSCTGSV